MTEINIQENEFDHDNSEVDMRYGFICSNSGGSSAQRIRLNTFYRNDIACSFQGNNRSSGTGESSTGLIFSFNLFGANELGEEITDKQNIKDVIIVPIGTVSQGVKLVQNNGIANQTPNNKWSQSMVESNDDIHEEISFVVHSYRENTTTDIPQELNGVQLLGSTQANTCTSEIDVPFLEFQGNEDVSALRQNTEIELNSLIQTYDALIDGGDTESLTDEVVYSTYTEALELYYELMSKSPALSEDVMLEAIQKDYELPAALLTSILSSNPTAAKSEWVQKELDRRALPLNEWQRTQIEVGLEIVSYKESLEEQITEKLTERWDFVNDHILEINSNSTIIDKPIAVLNIPDPNNFLSDRILTIQLMRELGMNESATLHLESIPQDFKCNEWMLMELAQLAQVWGQVDLVLPYESLELNLGKLKVSKEFLLVAIVGLLARL
ncbi:MAG: hypothetical protein SGI87_06500 [Flavobacteriales bacterium]|nr:hypothetical protein [Flavobacteriales bacterium]